MVWLCGTKKCKKAKLCYMDWDNFIVCTEIEDIYVDIAKDNGTRFDTLNYDLVVLLPKGKNKKVIGLTKNEVGGKIMTFFTALRS